MVAEAVARVEATNKFDQIQGKAADLQSLPMGTKTTDRVIAIHMLYHLPEPARGVAELARLVKPEGLVIAATNGTSHLRQLWSLLARVFGTEPIDSTVKAFGAETGFPILRQHFIDVRWIQYQDVLRVTNPDHIMDYLVSCPPGEDADQDQLRLLSRAVDQTFDEGGGVMEITKDVGLFQCRIPRQESLGVKPS